jgi:hypothetical protein
MFWIISTILLYVLGSLLVLGITMVEDQLSVGEKIVVTSLWPFLLMWGILEIAWLCIFESL